MMIYFIAFLLCLVAMALCFCAAEIFTLRREVREAWNLGLDHGRILGRYHQRYYMKSMGLSASISFLVEDQGRELGEEMEKLRHSAEGDFYKCIKKRYPTKPL